MKMDNNFKNAVKSANKLLYNNISHNYDIIDGRRSLSLENWLTTNIKSISKLTLNKRMLDIGTGSGFVIKCADKIYKERIGIDISINILSCNLNHFDSFVCGDIDHLPFHDNTFDFVTCFAVLHHLYDFHELTTEIFRVLKKGGVFYSDHDMDINFRNRFKFPLSLYRKLKNPLLIYKKYNPEINEDIFNLTEWQSKGIDSLSLKYSLETKGFTVQNKYHWFGLTKLTNILFGKKYFNIGNAPLTSIIAIKS